MHDITLKLMIPIEITSLTISEECQNDEILEFILAIDKYLENQEFTIDLIKELLTSLNTSTEEINAALKICGLQEE